MLKPVVKMLLMWTILGIGFTPVFAQQLGELIVEPVPEGEEVTVIVRNPEESILLVHSTIPVLMFEVNMGGLISVDNPDPGEYRLHLLPGRTHIVTFKADGFLPKKRRFYIPKKEYREIRISAKRKLPSSDQDLYEVLFEFNVSGVYCAYDQFAPLLKMGNTATFKLPAGEHTFYFEKDQYRPDSRTIKVDKDQTFKINLVADRNERVPYRPPGLVYIESDPPGAEVLINGQKVGSTPYQDNLSAGEHRLEVRKSMYYPQLSEFSLEAEDTKQIKLVLQPRFGYLNVVSRIEKVEIYLDGMPIGPTPITGRQVLSGKHTLLARKELYHDHTEEFEIRDNQRLSINMQSQPAFGMLEIHSSPEEGAEVWIDGQRKGQTPFTDDRVPSGRHEVEVRKRYFNPSTEAVTVSDGKTTKRTLIMSTNVGSLIVNAPGGTIYIDGLEEGKNRVERKLSPGKYRIRVEKPNHHTDEEEIFLSVGEIEERTFELMPRQGSISIMVEPIAARNADVYIDGQYKGQAPKVLVLFVGDYDVEVRQKEYTPLVKRVKVAENDNKQMKFAFTEENSRVWLAEQERIRQALLARRERDKREKLAREKERQRELGEKLYGSKRPHGFKYLWFSGLHIYSTPYGTAYQFPVLVKFSLLNRDAFVDQKLISIFWGWSLAGNITWSRSFWYYDILSWNGGYIWRTMNQKHRFIAEVDVGIKQYFVSNYIHQGNELIYRSFTSSEEGEDVNQDFFGPADFSVRYETHIGDTGFIVLKAGLLWFIGKGDWYYRHDVDDWSESGKDYDLSPVDIPDLPFTEKAFFYFGLGIQLYKAL